MLVVSVVISVEGGVKVSASTGQCVRFETANVSALRPGHIKGVDHVHFDGLRELDAVKMRYPRRKGNPP